MQSSQGSNRDAGRTPGRATIASAFARPASAPSTRRKKKALTARPTTASTQRSLCVALSMHEERARRAAPLDLRRRAPKRRDQLRHMDFLLQPCNRELTMSPVDADTRAGAEITR